MSFEQEHLPAAPASSIDPAPLASAPLIAAPAPPKEGIFVGRFGLRAGWGLTIYILLAAVFIALFTLGALAATGKLKDAVAKGKAQSAAAQAHSAHPEPTRPAAPTPPMHPRSAAINEALSFTALVLAAWIMTRIERRRFAVYGIGNRNMLSFLPGAFWGLLTLSLLVLVLHADHLLVFDSRALFGSMAVLYGLKWLIVFFFVGAFEEYFFRGYMQHALTRGFVGLAEKISAKHTRPLAFLFASLITSGIFFAAHTGNPGETAWGLFGVFLAGVVFTYALWRTGSLWWGIGFHMTWDWAQSFLYGVPDSGGLSFGRLFNTHALGNPRLSGGTDGPEGSLFVIPTLLLVLVIIRFTRPGAQPALEPEPRVPAPQLEQVSGIA